MRPISGAAAIGCALLFAAGDAAAQVRDSSLILTDSALAVPDALAIGPDTGAACLAIGAIGSVTEDHARLAQLTGATSPSSWLLRRSDPLRMTCMGKAPIRRAAAVRLLPAALQLTLRSTYEGGRNDGALWQGKGASTAFTAGARFQFSVFTVDVAPVVTFQQNMDYVLVPVPGADTTGMSRFANPWYTRNLDIPQRFGEASFTTFDLGQSRLAAELGPVEVGISNQNLWWGPGVHNALLMTNNAPGFMHAHVSTARPIDVGIAKLEFTLVGGQLRESEYQDTVAADDKALFRGLVLVLEPRGFESLYLGFARAFSDRWNDPGLGDFLDPLLDNPFAQSNVSADNPQGNSPGSQFISLFGRWVLPASGFEVWTEWGREDHAADLEDFLQEPDHSQAFVIGLQKVFGTARPVRFGAEWTDLSTFTPARAERPAVSWYWHGEASYTHEGQWLGTATGTGGDSQHFWLDSWWGNHSMGAYFERVRRHEDAYYATRTGNTIRAHDVEFTIGVRGTTRWRSIDLNAALEASHRYNRSFEGDANNLAVRFGASWWPQERPRNGPFPATASPSIEGRIR